ncbi:MAG: InlB B-repeat-containing protein [Erysipelotrichaceae bacterium]|nr:InlB B-repeat-containing protein [Erysipelotrichaceae bacterium]
MKKLLTVLLTTLMVVTMGTVNVLADSTFNVAKTSLTFSKDYSDDYDITLVSAVVNPAEGYSIDDRYDVHEDYITCKGAYWSITQGNDVASLDDSKTGVDGWTPEQVLTLSDSITNETTIVVKAEIYNHSNTPFMGTITWTYTVAPKEVAQTMICLLVKANADAAPDNGCYYIIDDSITWAGVWKNYYSDDAVFYTNPNDTKSVYSGGWTADDLYTNLAGASPKTVAEYLVGKEDNTDYDDLRGLAAWGEAYANMYVVELYTSATSNYHTVTFNYDIGGYPQQAKLVNDNETVERVTDPTFEGYAFKGWFEKEEDGSLKAVAFDFDTKITSDVDLYAKWVELHTVTFHDGANSTSVLVEDGAVLANDQFPTLTKENYEVDGWYYDNETFTQKYSNDVFNDDDDLYVKWVQTRFSVEFHYMDGDEEKIAYQGVDKGDKAIAPNIDDLEGYAIAGWYEEDTFETKWDFDTPITADQKLYGKLVPYIKAADVKVDPAKVAYTGKAQKATLLGLDSLKGNYTVEYKKADGKKWNKIAKDVATYDIKITIKEGFDGTFDNGKKELVIKNAYKIVNVLTASISDKTYNYKNQYPKVNDIKFVGSDKKTVRLSGKDVTIVKVEVKPYSYLPIKEETTECINVNKYYVTIKLKNSNYAFSADFADEITVEFNINPLEVELKPGKLVYNGKEQQPFSDEYMEKMGFKYNTVSDGVNSATNAGKYTAIVEITNKNLVWKKTGVSYTAMFIDWTIEKAELAKVRLVQRRPVSLKNSHADCTIANIDKYEAGTKFEEYVLGKGWVEILGSDEGLLLLEPGLHTIRAKADDNHKEVTINNWTMVYVTPSDVDYTLSGKAHRGDKKVVITCDREDYYNLTSVRIHIGDETIVLDSEDYVVEEGSTKVTITNRELINTLAVGEYEVGFIYSDGMHVSGTLQIKKKSSPATYELPKTGVR